MEEEFLTRLINEDDDFEDGNWDADEEEGDDKDEEEDDDDIEPEDE